MRHMKPTSVLISMVILVTFFIGGMLLMTKPYVDTRVEQIRISEKWK